MVKTLTLLILTLLLLALTGPATTEAADWSIEDETGVAIGDFEQQAGSPIINAGAPLDANYATDFDRNIRPLEGGWDLGPFESGTATSYSLKGINGVGFSYQ